MAKKRRYRTREARELADEITGAGGTVEVTAGNHLRVTGPPGIAVVGQNLSAPRAHDTARNLLARKAGIVVRRRGGGGARKTN